MLSDLNKLEQKLTSKITSSEKMFDTFSSVTQHKINMCQNKINELSSIQIFDELKEQIKNQISKFSLKFDDSYKRNEMRLSRMEKDLINFGFKYDKLFINNFDCPDLIGEGCQFNSIKTFFKYLFTKTKELNGSKNNSSSEIKAFKEMYKENLDQFFNKITTELVKNKQEMHDLCLRETHLIKNKCNDKIKCIEDKVEFIRMENGKYSFDIIKNTENLQERLNEEAKKFCEVNQNLIKYLNTLKKDQKKNTLSKKKTVSTEMLANELLPSLKKLQESINFKCDLSEKKNIKKIEHNVIGEINFEIKNDKSKEVSTNSIHNSKKSLNTNFSIENIKHEIINSNNIKDKNLDKAEKKIIDDKSNIDRQNKNNTSLFYNKKGRNATKIGTKTIFLRQKLSPSNTTENEFWNKNNINIFRQKIITTNDIEDNKEILNSDTKNNIIKSENILTSNSRKDRYTEASTNTTVNNINFHKSADNLTKLVGVNGRSDKKISLNKMTQKAVNFRTNTEEDEYNIPRLILADEKQNKSRKSSILGIRQISENLQSIEESINKINITIDSFFQNSDEKFHKLSKEISYLHNEYKKLKISIEEIKLTKNNINFNGILGKKLHNKTLTTFSDICFPLKQYSQSKIPDNKRCINLEKKLLNSIEFDNSSSKREEKFMSIFNRIEPYLIKKFKK